MSRRQNDIMPNTSKIVLAAEQRIPYHVMQAVLRNNGLPSFRSWKKIPDILLDWTREHPDEAPPEETLMGIFKDHLIAGEKALKTYCYEETEENPNLVWIVERLKELNIEENYFHETYPLPLDSVSLSKVPKGCFPTKIFVQDKQIFVVFCSRRTYRMEEDIDIPLDDKRFEGYSELVGIRMDQQQRFDCVVIDPISKVIQFRIDAAGKPKNCNTNNDKSEEEARSIRPSFRDILLATEELDKAFKKLLHSTTGYQVKYGEPWNLYEALRSFYDNEECCLIEIGFKTDGGAPTKTAKSRRIGQDIRKDRFHKGGSEAVEDKIDPYKVSVQWPKQLPHVELHIPGRVAMLNQIIPVIDLALINGCASEGEFSFVLQMLKKAINQ